MEMNTNWPKGKPSSAKTRLVAVNRLSKGDLDHFGLTNRGPLIQAVPLPPGGARDNTH